MEENKAIINFDRKCIPSPEYVVLRVISITDKMEIDGIAIPESAYVNLRLGHYIVEAVGEIAAKEYGLKPGDYVSADKLAAAYPSAPICVMHYSNIICLTNADKTVFKPLKNMVFVKDNINNITDVDGILVQNYARTIKTGTIISMNIEEGCNVPYKIGDEVMLTRHADFMKVGTEDIYIYKKDALICKIEKN